jgi:hypothetical protein
MKSGNFFAELKRRNVYKVAVAYAVVSWLLIQAASILFPTFDAPAWAMKVLVALVVLCFPVALVLSWAFEITPEGIKLESEIDPKKSITRTTRSQDYGSHHCGGHCRGWDVYLSAPAYVSPLTHRERSSCDAE